MNTNDLMDRLAKKLEPVQVRSPWKSAAFVYVLSFSAVAVVGTILYSSRPDLTETFGKGVFLFNMLGMIFMSLIFTVLVFLSAVPGRIENRRALIAASAFLTVLLLGLVCWPSEESPMRGGHEKMCSYAVITLSIIPAVIQFFFLRKLAPLSLVFSGVMASLAAASFGAFALGFCCPNDHPTHLLIWHTLIPMGGLGVVGALAGRRLLRW